MRHLRALCLSLVVLAVVPGCGDDDSSSVTSGATDTSPEFLANLLQNRRSNVSRTPAWYDSLDDLLPNVAYRRADGSSETLSDLVVLGRVVRVEPSQGFVVRGEDAPGGIASDFDDPDALWWTVTATVEVTRTVSGQAESDQIRVGLVTGPPSDFERIESDLLGIESILLFLTTGSPVFSYDETLFAVVEDGNFLLTVDSEGRLAMPAFEPAESEALLRETPTIGDLEAAAQGPARTVELESRGGYEVPTSADTADVPG